MALKAIIESLEGLSEEIKKEYKERDDGKYQLDVTSVDGLELAEVSKLQSALSKERENNRKTSEQLKNFENLDPEKAREAIQKVEEMASWTPEQKVKEQIEAVKSQLVDAHGKEKKQLENKITALTKSLEEAMIVSVASQALAEHKGSVKLLMPHIRQQTRLREVDGKHVVEVVDESGNPRLTGTDAHPMGIGELVSEMKTQNDFASAFEGTGATGSGATGSNKGTRTVDLSGMTPQQKMRYARQHGKTK